MPITTTLISEADITARIRHARRRNRARLSDGEAIHLVGVLKGGFMFMADLVRAMSPRVTMDFMAVSSYGKGTNRPGRCAC